MRRLLPAGLAIFLAFMLFHAAPALAQSFTFDTGGDQTDATARIIQLVALLTVGRAHDAGLTAAVKLNLGPLTTMRTRNDQHGWSISGRRRRRRVRR